MLGDNAFILLALGAAFLLLLFALWVVVGRVTQTRERARRLNTESTETVGEVVGRRTTRDRHYVRYRFTANQPEGRGVRLQAEDQIRTGLFEKLRTGTRVRVAYVPDKPEYARLRSVVARVRQTLQ